MSRLLVCDYPSALEFLRGRVNYERTTFVSYEAGDFKLDRMRRLLALLGDPHLGLAAIHIAGTKGKGSTAAMLASVLRAGGFKAGLYTSPHLSQIEERIAIDGRPCSQAEFARLAAEVERAVGRLRLEAADPMAGDPMAGEPTFFEVTTAMAFLHFARERVAAAVLEVGLGGRLDSTNVCSPSVSIITSISFDHTRQLGNTLAAIAAEKAGIIKRGVPVVCGVLAEEPRDVIHRIARELAAPLFQLGDDFAFDAGQRPQSPAAERLDYREPAEHPTWQLDDVQLGLLGRHQAANAATAIAAVRCLRRQGWAIGDQAIRQGLAAARCPARIEVLGRQPTAIVDVAHNAASIRALIEVLGERFPAQTRRLIFASSRDKDTTAMLQLLLPEFSEIALTRYIENPRAVEPEQLEELATGILESPSSYSPTRQRPTLHTMATPAQAWQWALQQSAPGDLVCITGSFFLAAELRPLVLASRLEPTNGS
ncbi:MAG: folylpolyglutamate synthase/dihydrofolate synthase family protein [Pirellulaceae bacterium]